MEYLTNSFEEKPRSAPVPASFSGGPFATGVPEVSLVFSPSSASRLDLFPVPKASVSKIPFKNELNQENKPLAPISKDMLNLSPLTLHRKEMSSKETMQKSPMSQNRLKNLESVSEMANRIMKENTGAEEQGTLQSNTNFKKSTRIQGNIKPHVDNGMMTENGGKQFHVSVCHVSENGERYQLRYPEKNDTLNCSNWPGQLRNNHGDLGCTNNNSERNTTNETHMTPVLTDQTHMTSCGSMSHQINKQCFCLKGPVFESDLRCSASNSNAPCHGSGMHVACSNSINNGDSCLNVASCNTTHQALSDNPHQNVIKYSSCSCSCESSKTYKNNDNYQCYHNNVGMNYYHPVYNNSKAYLRDGSIDSYHNRDNTIHDDDNDVMIRNPGTSCMGNFQKGNNRSTILHKQTSSLKKIEEETINDVNIREKSSSDSSLLQKIVLMNEQQFTVLQGLLQQVVEMQGEQMKVLKEINANLTQHLISDEHIQKDKAHLDILEKDASTQTNSIKDAGTSSEDVKIAKKDKLTHRENSSKDSEIRNSQLNNQDSSPKNRNQSPELVLVPEKEKSKNLRDKAVSWSAIHGVGTVEESITLHSIHVPTVEQMPSSVHTMHLHLQDYHSSASFESISESKHSSESRFSESSLDNKKSWTLYDNIVGHVKKFLQTVPCENNPGNLSQKTSQVEAIRFATIEKIRQLGVSVYENSAEIKEVNTVGRIHFDPNLSPYHSPDSSPLNTENNSNDASLELQALALKYLPAEELDDLTKWSQGGKANPVTKAGQRSNNVSLATQNYLEKYHLLPSFAEIKDTRQMCGDRSPVVVGGNILDITTLKKQPKLL